MHRNSPVHTISSSSCLTCSQEFWATAAIANVEKCKCVCEENVLVHYVFWRAEVIIRAKPVYRCSPSWSCIIIPISWFRISANRPSTLEVSFSMLTFLMLLVFLMLICIHRHIPSPVLVPIFSGLYRRLRLKRVNICYLISVPHFITPLPIHTYLYLNDWSLSKPQQPYCVGLDCSRFFSLYFWFSASQYRNR